MYIFIYIYIIYIYIYKYIHIYIYKSYIVYDRLCTVHDVWHIVYGFIYIGPPVRLDMHIDIYIYIYLYIERDTRIHTHISQEARPVTRHTEICAAPARRRSVQIARHRPCRSSTHKAGVGYRLPSPPELHTHTSDQ